MLIRIVRMTLKEDKVEEFLSVFNDRKEKIRHFPGCSHLELMRDYTMSNVFSTYSHWKNEEALNNYRDSELFGQVWKQTKVLFAEKPVAFSLKKYIGVD